MEARQHTQELAAVLNNEKIRVDELETILGGVVDRLTTLTPIPWTIAGFDVVGEERVEFHFAELDIIYKLRTNCRFSSENVPILNRMRRDGYRVLGVVPDDSRAAVRIFSETHRTEFPVVAEPDGVGMSILPRRATPLTVRLLEGEIVDLMLGALDGARVTSPLVMDPPEGSRISTGAPLR